jgi:hypothetical protein
MKRYYEYSDTDWGDYPRINLNSWSCDTLFWIDEAEKEAGGFVYCKFGYHPKPDNLYDLAKTWILRDDVYEITESQYREIGEDFMNRY